MEFAHAFWSKPLFENKFNKFKVSLANTLYDYAYSLECIHKAGFKITMYSDEVGLQLFQVLPYDNFVQIPISDDNNVHFAASAKFYALQRMNLSDVLIDGDVMLELPNIFKVLKLNTSDVIYSFYENNKILKQTLLNEEYFADLLSLLSNNNLDYELPTYEDIAYPNTSLIKFNNQQFKDEYISQYFSNIKKLEHIDFKYTWPDIIIEQYFLKCLANKNNYSMKDLIVNYPDGTKYTKTLGLTHLGNQKTNVLPKVKSKLYKLNPKLKYKVDLYYKEVLKIFDKE